MDGLTNKSKWKNKRNSVQKSDFSWCIFALLLNVFEEIGKFRFNSVNSRKNCTINGKI